MQPGGWILGALIVNGAQADYGDLVMQDWLAQQVDPSTSRGYA
jgi:hypothetical protein